MKHILSAAYFIIILFSIFVMVACHEEVHVAIFEAYGIDSEVDLFDTTDGWLHISATTTVTSDNAYLCNDSCALAHNINEAISYVLIPAFMMLAFGLFFVIMALEELK